MSLSTDLEVRHIFQLANLYEKENDLKDRLSSIYVEINNLILCMPPEDVKEARLMFESKFDQVNLWADLGVVEIADTRPWNYKSKGGSDNG